MFTAKSGFPALPLFISRFCFLCFVSCFFPFTLSHLLKAYLLSVLLSDHCTPPQAQQPPGPRRTETLAFTSETGTTKLPPRLCSCLFSSTQYLQCQCSVSQRDKPGIQTDGHKHYFGIICQHSSTWIPLWSARTRKFHLSYVLRK